MTLDGCIEDFGGHARDVALLADGTDLIPQLKDRVRNAAGKLLKRELRTEYGSST